MTKVTIDLHGYPLDYAVRNLRAGRPHLGIYDLLADELEKHIPKPKPEEPTGLFAVVEDRRGEKWVNWRDPDASIEHSTPWVQHRDSEVYAEYADIDVVKVHFSGV